MLLIWKFKLRKTKRKLTNRTVELGDLQEEEAGNFSQNTQVTCIPRHTGAVCMCAYTHTFFNVYVCVHIYKHMKENSKSCMK